MFVERVTDAMLREESDGKLYIRYNDHQSENFVGTNKEAIHTILANGGFKKVGKQEGSEIGGTYVRP